MCRERSAFSSATSSLMWDRIDRSSMIRTFFLGWAAVSRCGPSTGQE